MRAELYRVLAKRFCHNLLVMCASTCQLRELKGEKVRRRFGPKCGSRDVHSQHHRRLNLLQLHFSTRSNCQFSTVLWIYLDMQTGLENLSA